MTTYEMLATVASAGGLLIAIVGIVISVVSLRRTGKLDSRQSLLREKQVELAELQLDLTRKQATLADAAAIQQAPDVRVSLDGAPVDYHFLITNWGDAPARDVHFDAQSPSGLQRPFIDGDLEEKLPIPVLAAGARCSIFAVVTFETGTVFDATWDWTNPDGSVERRESRMTLP